MEIKELINKEKYNIEDLLSIMEILRSPNGCPWDREQDHKSIRQNFIEECYEAIEAIDTEDTELLKEELGDVLLQVAFHSEMAKENGEFTFDEVVHDVCYKLVIRHPHVFSDTVADTTGEVLMNWDMIKQETKKQKSVKEVGESIAKTLPALMRHQKLLKKMNKFKISFNKDIDFLLKSDKIDSERIGEALSYIINIANENDIDAEKALTDTTNKYIERL